MPSLKRSDEWIAEHFNTLGSTAAGIVAGESPYKTSVDLYNDMIDVLVYKRDLHEKITDDMKRGIMTEPLHRQLLEDELHVNVHDHDQEEFIYNEKYPWAHALPDGWIYATEEHVPVQLKCPRIRAWHEIKLKGIHGHWMLGSQHTLAVTDAPYEQFSVLNPESFRLITFPVQRDEKLIESLMGIERNFYDQHYVPRVPPFEKKDPDMFPEIKGKLITLDDDKAIETSRFYREAKTLLEDAQAMMDQARDQVKDLMQDAEVIELPGLRAYHQTLPGRVTLDKNRMMREGIDISKYEKQGRSFKLFKAYFLGR